MLNWLFINIYLSYKEDIFLLKLYPNLLFTSSERYSAMESLANWIADIKRVWTALVNTEKLCFGTKKKKKKDFGSCS